MDVQLSVKDVTGRDIIQVEEVNGVSTINRSFNLDKLSNGLYYVELRTSQGLVVEPILKN